jgi:hypothetical protein
MACADTDVGVVTSLECLLVGWYMYLGSEQYLSGWCVCYITLAPSLHYSTKT